MWLEWRGLNPPDPLLRLESLPSLPLRELPLSAPLSTPPLLGKTRFLEAQIDEFLNKVSEGAIYFQRGIELLLERFQAIRTM